MNPNDWQTFLASLHRRLVIARTLERIGICSLIAGTGAMAMLVIALLRGEPATWLAPIALAVAILCGTCWGLMAPPSKLAAALEADRQLQTHDLLSTALSLQEPTPHNDAWARTIAAIADARCREVSPSLIVLHRWGMRAWGGVGLAWAMLVSLGLMQIGPATSAASEPGETPSMAYSPLPSARPRRTFVNAQDVPGARATARPDDPESTHVPQETGTTAPINASAGAGASGPDSPAPGLKDSTHAGRSGTGGATSTAQPHPSRETSDPPSHPGSPAQPRPNDAARGITAGGIGNANAGARDPSAPAGSTGAAAGIIGASPAVSDWAPDSSGSPMDVTGAKSTGIQSIPDAYRDVLRAYFDRQP